MLVVECDLRCNSSTFFLFKLHHLPRTVGQIFLPPSLCPPPNKTQTIPFLSKFCSDVVNTQVFFDVMSGLEMGARSTIADMSPDMASLIDSLR